MKLTSNQVQRKAAGGHGVPPPRPPRLHTLPNQAQELSGHIILHADRPGLHRPHPKLPPLLPQLPVPQKPHAGGQGGAEGGLRVVRGAEDRQQQAEGSGADEGGAGGERG